MKHTLKSILAISASLFISGILSPTLSSAHSRDHTVLAQASSKIDKSTAAKMAKQRYGGKVLKVDSVERNGKQVFHVRLLLDGGKVKTVKIDAGSGKLS